MLYKMHICMKGRFKHPAAPPVASARRGSFEIKSYCCVYRVWIGVGGNSVGGVLLGFGGKLGGAAFNIPVSFPSFLSRSTVLLRSPPFFSSFLFFSPTLGVKARAVINAEVGAGIKSEKSLYQMG